MLLDAFELANESQTKELNHLSIMNLYILQTTIPRLFAASPKVWAGAYRNLQ